jgi:hypothetical protein
VLPTWLFFERPPVPRGSFARRKINVYAQWYRARRWWKFQR